MFAALLASSLILALAAGAAPSYVSSPADGAACATVCSSVSQNSAALQQFNVDDPVLSAACAANVTGVGLVAGYQLSGNSSCTTSWNDSLVDTTDFSCLCISPDDSMGLVQSNDETCDYACNQTVDGLIGLAAQPDASVSNAACLASSEIGELNRFGHTLPTESGVNLCYTAVDGAAQATPSYSCFCTFATAGELQPVAPSGSSDDDSSSSSDALASGG